MKIGTTPTADGSPGIQRRTLRCKCRTDICTARKRSIRVLTSTVRAHRRFTICRSGPDANWSSSFLWTEDRNTGECATHAFLFETNYQRGRNTFYTRWERVEESRHELVLAEADHDRVFSISGYTASSAILRTAAGSMLASALNSR